MTWRCERCDEPHEADDPPCDNCGHESFETVADRSSAPDPGPDTFEWVCRECGRSHPKHSPPCSRCGHVTLEKQRVEYDLDDVEPAGYLELGKWHIAAVAVLVALVGLTATGVVSVPQVGGPPAIDDAPGDGERAAGIDLTEAETRIRDRVDEYRQERGLDALAADSELDAIVTYHNRHRALAAHDEDVARPSLQDDYDRFNHRCGRHPRGEAFPAALLGIDGSVETYENESDLATAVAGGLVSSQARDGPFLVDWNAFGLDLYVRADGTIDVALLLC